MKNILKILAIGGLLCGLVSLAHAQSVPQATGQWCSSNGTPAGPWSPCAAPAGGSSSNPAYSVQPPIAYGTPHQVVLSQLGINNPFSPFLIVPAGTYTHTVTICSLPAAPSGSGTLTPGYYQLLFFLSLDGSGDATTNSGLYVPENGGCVSMVAPTGAIYGVAGLPQTPLPFGAQIYLTYQGG